MEQKTNSKTKNVIKLIAMAMLITVIAVTPAFAWFGLHRDLASYAPIDAPQALFIGAGHCDFDENYFEDIRYLYFDATDYTSAQNNEYYYRDWVFCVYGIAISKYKLQLGFTTNNQFTYEIYEATESTVDSSGIAYTAHDAGRTTYYYSRGAKLEGSYLNAIMVDSGGTLVWSDGVLANDTYHNDAYGSHALVQKNAEALYWQNSSSITGDSNSFFVNYYILRVRSETPIEYNRETDIICISTKTVSD